MVRKGGVDLLSDGECWLGMAEAGVPMTRAHSTLAVALAVALALTLTLTLTLYPTRLAQAQRRAGRRACR